MEDILSDFSIMAILLMAGYWLRIRIKIFQRYHLPASVIAGVLGLLLGTQVLGKITPVCIRFSMGSKGYLNILMMVVFTSAAMGVKINRGMLKNGFNFLMLTSATLLFQVILGYGMWQILHMLGSKLPVGFSVLPSTGFYGGHGIGAATAAAFESAGHWDAGEIMSISTTFATIGLLFGIAGGILAINIGASKGIAGYLSHKVPEDKTQQVIREHAIQKHAIQEYEIQEQEARIRKMRVQGTLGKDIKPGIDPLAVQVCAVLVIYLCGMGITKVLSYLPMMGNLSGIAGVAIASIIGNVVYNRTKLGEIWDIATIKHITNTAMEFLITGAIAGTSIEVVTLYGKEIVITSLVILAVNTVFVFWATKRLFKNDWFEHAVTIFGVSTGVTATSLMLLHIVDPQDQSSVKMSIPISILTSIVTQTFCLSMAPILLLRNEKGLILGLILVVFIMLGLARAVADRA